MNVSSQLTGSRNSSASLQKGGSSICHSGTEALTHAGTRFIECQLNHVHRDHASPGDEPTAQGPKARRQVVISAAPKFLRLISPLPPLLCPPRSPQTLDGETLSWAGGEAQGVGGGKGRFRTCSCSLSPGFWPPRDGKSRPSCCRCPTLPDSPTPDVGAGPSPPTSAKAFVLVASLQPFRSPLQGLSQATRPLYSRGRGFPD